jgi:NAD(P)-dependent dehydrogenase (short-subunit alcohol dehydrogenase family)
VAGGASGIGLGITKALLSEGMNVAIGDVNDSHIADARASGWGERFIRHVDVTDRVCGEGCRRGGGCLRSDHVLCNNAGIAGGGAVADPGFADWDRAVAVNLGGAVNVVKIFVP